MSASRLCTWVGAVISGGVTPEQYRGLTDYLVLLQKWSRSYNLVGDPELGRMVQHLADAVVMSRLLTSGCVLDLGTGAGLPGVLLAILRPEMPICLLDSNGKKMRFLHEVVRTIGLENVVLHHGRAEAFVPVVPYDAVVCRMFGSLSSILSATERARSAKAIVLTVRGCNELPETAPAGYNTASFEVVGADSQRAILRVVPT